MSYSSKQSALENRQLKTQRVVIPFALTANATPASVVLRNDEPSVMFLKSEGVDQITSELSLLGDTFTFSAAPVDANGILNILIVVGEEVIKVCGARMVSRTTGVSQPLYIGDADGISSLGSCIGLVLDSSVNHATTNVDGVIEVEYVVGL